MPYPGCMDFTLDPDDSRPPYVQIASALRAAILTKKFEPGGQLPSAAALAKQYGVARQTAHNALATLRDEGLVVSRVGSGVFVRERPADRPVGLDAHIDKAFRQPDVSIDFAGYSGETLRSALNEPLGKIRDGRITPQSVTLRALVPDNSQPLALPRPVDGDDDPAFRQRADTIMRRSLPALAESLQELADLGLVPKVSAQVRTHHVPPLFKMYILNKTEVFFGFYPVREHVVMIKDEPHPMYDLMGVEAEMFHYQVGDDTNSRDARYVGEASTWFDSIWTTIAEEFPV